MTIDVMYTRTNDGDYIADFDCNESDLPKSNVFFYVAIQANELAALRQRVSDLEAKLKSDAVLTPRKCVTCDGQRMAEEMREACADAVRKLSRMNSAYEDVIRAIPLPVCNPLAPSQSDLDMLAAWHERM